MAMDNATQDVMLGALCTRAEQARTWLPILS